MKRWGPPILVVLLGSISLTGASGCGRVCTLVGCNDSIRWELPTEVFETGRRVTITACAAGECQTRVVSVSDQASSSGEPDFWLVLDPGTLDRSGPVDATITVTDARGAVLFTRSDLVSLDEYRPNGPRCLPTCGVGIVLLETP